MTRGDIYWADDAAGGRRPVVIIARTEALPHLIHINVAPTTTSLRDIPSHVRIDHGLPHTSDINCDAIATIRRAELTEPIGTLDDDTQRELDAALRFALGLDR
jgi:mRNA interferase MazF